MGRKPIYKTESLEIGGRIELKGKPKKYSWQYLNNFNERGEAKYKHIKDGKNIFIERIV